MKLKRIHAEKGVYGTGQGGSVVNCSFPHKYELIIDFFVCAYIFQITFNGEMKEVDGCYGWRGH